MSNILLTFPAIDTPLRGSLQLPGSKSESNRMLLLQGHYPELRIENLSDSDDTRFMQRGLEAGGGEIDIHHAGTAMRFLTAYFATTPGTEAVLTGSQRMTERPIAILVDALRSLGADIAYLGREGYPPIRVRGSRPHSDQVRLRADVSSQYISALLLSAARFPQGLTLRLDGKVTSLPYIRMTLSLLDQLGIPNEYSGDTIRIEPRDEVGARRLVVESDWSAASYFYSMVALAPLGSRLTLGSFREDSLQGDQVVSQLYRSFGVKTTYADQRIELEKERDSGVGRFEADLADAPDIAQTLAVTCFGLGWECRLTGLHTLPIKETDRLAALRTELGKLGGEVATDQQSLYLNRRAGEMRPGVWVDTYNDHRMAMAFAPLGLLRPIGIRDHGVVSKSYPAYWAHLSSLGFRVEPQD